MKRQLAFILARAQVPYHWLQHSTTDDDGDETLEELPEDLQDILFNSRLSNHFKQFGKELGVLDRRAWRTFINPTWRLPVCPMLTH